MDLITIHTELNYRRYKTGKAIKPNCRFCGLEEEPITDILCDYESLSHVNRRILVTSFIEEPYFEAVNTRKLIQFWRKVIN